jgi:hypothetical protein
LHEYQAQNHPNYDAAVFHAQQCAEQYWKAIACGLNPYAVIFRFQGESATRDQALAAIQAIKKLGDIFIEITSK